MPLALALKNRTGVVVACDEPDSTQFGQLISLPNRAFMTLTGNRKDTCTLFENEILPHVRHDMSAAELAQLVQAELVQNVVPDLPNFKGRLEIIVAGIDPIRHVNEPGLYYMDSAREFYLNVVREDAVAAGSTAAVTSLLAGHDFSNVTLAQLTVLAKECLSATKLRWPTTIGTKLKIGLITPESTSVQEY